MPVNKNAQQRYKTLDKCLSNQFKLYTIEDLLETVNFELKEKHNCNGIKKRQLREDLRFMRANGAPIYTHKPDFDIDGPGQPIYYYGSKEGRNTDYRFFGSTLNKDGRDTISKTVELLKLYQDLPGFGWIEDITNALEIEFDEQGRQNYVSFERNPDLKGLKWLTTLIKHTMNEQPIRVTYRSFFGEKKKIHFHPYHLKQFNNRWFLWGLDEDRNMVSNLALDRIDNFVEMKDHTFIRNDKVDFSTYFDDIIGVTVKENTPTEQIILRFSKERLPYVLNKPIHKSQQLHPDIPDAITLRLKPNRELEARILNYGPDVEVIAPERLRNQIAEKAHAMMKLYFPHHE